MGWHGCASGLSFQLLHSRFTNHEGLMPAQGHDTWPQQEIAAGSSPGAAEWHCGPSPTLPVHSRMSNLITSRRDRGG